MCLAAEDELDAVGADAAQALEVAENEVRSFVGGKAPSKSDCKAMFLQFHTGGGANQFSEHSSVGLS